MMNRLLFICLAVLLIAPGPTGAAPIIAWSVSETGPCIKYAGDVATWSICYDAQSGTANEIPTTGASLYILGFTLGGSGPSRTLGVSGRWQATLHLKDTETGATADAPIGGNASLLFGSPYDFSATLDVQNVKVGDKWFSLTLAGVGYPGPYGDVSHASLNALLTYTPNGPAPVNARFVTQPAGGQALHPISPQPVIAALRADGSVETDYQGPVTVQAVYHSEQSYGTTLQGTTTVNAVNGIATFTDLSFNHSCSVSLQAVIDNLPAVSSQTIYVSPTPTHLVVYSVDDQAPGVSFVYRSVEVSVRDDREGFYDSYNKPITISIQPNTGATGAALTGTTTAYPNGSSALFNNLSIDKPGTGYVIVASAEGLAPGYSPPFNVGWEWIARRALRIFGGLTSGYRPSNVFTAPIDVTEAVHQARKAAGLE